MLNPVDLEESVKNFRPSIIKIILGAEKMSFCDYDKTF